MLTHAFTCTGPYAVLIMLGIKRTENRSQMPVPREGRCAVSCSKSFNAAEYGNFIQWASTHLPPAAFERLPAWADVKDWPGKVVGCCDYSARAVGTGHRGCVVRDSRSGVSDSRENWAEGYDWWWDLSQIVCFDRPIPCRGNVGMWQMPPALGAEVSRADALASCVGERISTAQEAERLFRLAIPLAGGNEGFFVLPLDATRHVLSEPVLVSLGDPSTTVIEPSEVFAVAFRTGASAILIAHNHPSGNPTPSVQDRELTTVLVDLGERLGVKVLDHIVLGKTTASCVFLQERER